MSYGLENSIINKVNYLKNKIIIETNNLKSEIYYHELLNIETKEIDLEDNSGTIGTILGTVVGIAMGEFTAILGGGFSGWLISKFFSKKKNYFLIFHKLNKDPITFATEKPEEYLEEISHNFNNYYQAFLNNYYELVEKFSTNLSSQSKKQFISHSTIFEEIKNDNTLLLNKVASECQILDQNNNELLQKINTELNKINNKRKRNNEIYINNNIKNKYFNNLITSQKKAVLVDEDCTLVNAGAGSGKTTTILHKISHLIENNLCTYEEILVLAFNDSVRKELIERLNNFNNNKTKKELKVLADENVHTFHSYGLSQIEDKKVSETIDKVSSFENEQAIRKGIEINTIIEKLIKNKKFKEDLIKYFSEYFFTYKDYFEDIKNFKDYVKYIRNIGQVTLNGDFVRSYEEVEISNYLYINGINFEYEKEYKGKYKYDEIEDFDEQKANDDDAWYSRPDYVNKKINHLRKKKDSNYNPDFYLTDYDIYLEHFALDENNNAPAFFKEPGGYYTEYLHKIKLHSSNKTKLITTFSWQKSRGVLLKNLEKQLKKFNVKLKKRKDEEILKKFKKLGNVNNFSKLVYTFMSHFKSNEYKIKDIKKKIFSVEGDINKNRSIIFINLFEEIFNEYQENLKKEKAIDYDDMIIEGRKNLKNEKFKYILVDEFQDISQARAKLLKQLQIINNAKLYCVGDDWQAIYKFIGGDISIFTKDFEKQFGFYERVDIDTTFRFGKKINHISSNFIQKNPDQLKKIVKSFSNTDEGLIKMHHENDFSELIEKLTKKTNKKIFILGRYNLNQYNNSLKKNMFKSNIITKDDINYFLNNKKYNVEYKTIHRSKGLEADIIILVNVFSGKDGFPSQKEDDNIISLVLPNPETYPYSEERRLMYVSITRAKKEVHIFTGEDFAVSDFVKEIESDFPNHIFQDKRKLKNTKLCPTHKLKLIRKTGYRGPFYGCPKWKPGGKGCNYTEDAK